jgi:hypothetical protein
MRICKQGTRCADQFEREGSDRASLPLSACKGSWIVGWEGVGIEEAIKG